MVGKSLRIIILTLNNNDYERSNFNICFLKSEEQLKQSLQGLRLPKDYVELQKAVNSHIESLLVKENDFRNSLNASDAEMLTHALRMALSFQKLSLTESIDFKTLSIRKDYKVNQSTNDNTDIIESVLSLLPTVICAFINPWLAVAVGAGTVGAKKIYRQKNGRKYVVQEIKKMFRVIYLKRKLKLFWLA